MNNVLLFIGALLVVALAALFAVPHFIDWSTYRSGFETQASKLIGRDVRVGGSVNLRLLPAPYVSFENVRVADQDGRFSEPPLRVEAFTLWLSIPPLLRGAIEASQVELRRPEFLVRMQDRSTKAGTSPAAAMTALPMSIVLRSVNIRDGVVRIRDAAGAEIVAAEQVTGEFSAPSLEGPFRFRGTLMHNGRERDLRISTGRQEADGGLPVDGTVRAIEQASVYQLKGRITAFATDPTFVGDLMVQPTAERGVRTKQAGKDDALPFYEIKSRLRMGLSEAKLDDLTIVFEQAGRPQMMGGNASMAFGDEKKLVAALDARWLDLDQIAGVQATGDRNKPGPYSGLARLVALARAWLPAGVATNLRLGVEQATLGGDTINRIELALEQGKDSLNVTRFSADVPGSGRVRLSGLISGLSVPQTPLASPAAGHEPTAAGTGQGAAAVVPASPPSAAANIEGVAFQGPFQLHGQNLKRFLAWAAPGSDQQVQDAAGAFSLSGKLSLAEGRIGISRLRGELAATSFEGNASIDLASGAANSRPGLTLSIDSDRLDLRPILSGSAKLEDIWRRIQGDGPVAPAPRRTGPAPETVAVAGGFAERLASVNSEMRLRAGRLLLPDVELRDVDADISRTDNATTMRTLRFVASNGLKVQADGQIQTVDGRQRGAIKTVVELEQPAALGALLRFIDLPETHVLEPRAATILPLRLAGILTLGVRGGTGFELLVDGAAQDSRASMVVRADQEPTSWRTGLLDVTGMLENARSSQLLAQILPDVAPLSLGAGEQGRLSVRANGIPKTGISTAIELESKAVEAGFSGVITLPGEQPSMAGEIGLKAADVADGLRLAGLKGVRALQGRDLVLHTRMSAKGDEIQVTEAALRLGSASAEAHGRIIRRDGRLEVDMKAKAADASLPALLAMTLGTGQEGASKDKISPASSGPFAAGAQAIWADEAIDLAAFGNIGGKVRLEAGTLSLGQALTLRKSVLELELTPSAFDIKSLTGETLGGQVSATARAEKSQTGMTMHGTVKADGLVLDRIIAAEGDTPAASGAASGTVSFAGRGLTPRGVVGSLSGSGNLQLRNARFTRFGAEALEAVVAQLLTPAKDELGKDGAGNNAAATAVAGGREGRDADEIKVDPGMFTALIAAQLAKTPLVIGTRAIPLEIIDGAVRSKPLAFDVPRGRVKASNFLDLATLRIDSEWTIETLARFEARAKPPASGKAAGASAAAALQIPSINLLLTGSLAELPRLEPQVNSDTLARELLVRRMERDVELLERSRKQREEAEARHQKAREQDKDDSDRQRAEQRKREDPGSAKAETLSTGSTTTKTSGPASKAPAAGEAGSGRTGDAAPIPVPMPVPVQTDAGQSAAPASAAIPAPPEGAIAPKSSPAFSPPPTTSRPRLDTPANPPPKVSRPPSVFEQSRGL